MTNISKEDALEICRTCQKKMQKGCIITDIESAREEYIETPVCMQLFSEKNNICKNTHEATKTIHSHDEKSTQAKTNVETQRVHSHDEKSTLSRENSTLSGRPSEQKPLKLTRTEREILSLWNAGNRTAKKIATKRKCQPNIIFRHLRNLKKKGVLNQRKENSTLFEGCTVHSQEPEKVPMQQPAGHGGAVKEKRLHGQQLHIQILESSKKYQQHIGATVSIEGNHISLNRNVIQVNSNTSFYHNDPYTSFMHGLEYWYRIFSIIENDFGITLVKDRKANIRFVKAGEYGEVGNELAIHCNKEGDKIAVYGDDGKRWFLIDSSFNLNEAETVHPQEAQRDMAEVVAPFFNDLRKNPVTLSELMAYLRADADERREVLHITKELAAALNITYAAYLPKEKDEPAHTETKKEKPDDHGMYG